VRKNVTSRSRDEEGRGILNANLMAIRLLRIVGVIMFARKRKRNMRLF